MRSSCIRHPEREPLIVLRKWQVEACDGNKCAALLLSYFEYWHNIKLEQRGMAAEANNIAEAHGDSRTQDETLYQFHTEAQLEEGLVGLYGRIKIKEAISLLVDKKFISVHQNPNPRYKFDRTRHFMFYPEALNEWLATNRSPKNEFTSHKNSGRSSENRARSSENRAAIPKTTTEITTKVQKIQNIVLSHWNSKKIKTHRALTDKMTAKIRSTLKNYTEQEILAAIDTYAEILKGSQYYFKHTWGLDDFLQRGISKFDNREIAIKNYHKDRDRRQEEEESTHPAHVFRGTRRIADENTSP